MIKRLLNFMKKKEAPKKPERVYKNRFEKFYYLNKEKIRKERKERYYQKKKKGICIKCTKKAIPGINFCPYHRKQNDIYNRNQRKNKK